MANYLSLEEAAKKLGIPTDRLVELRSQGQLRGFRDGSSWKFPENEIERMQDELADSLSGGSDLGIGDDFNLSDGSGTGSDVNLIAAEGEGSDVAIIASDSDLLNDGSSGRLLEIDSADLSISEPAIMHDSSQLDLGIEPKSGSTNPEDEKSEAEKPAKSSRGSEVLAGDSSAQSDGGSSGSMFDLDLEEDSGDEILGGDDDSALDVLGSDVALDSGPAASSLEMMSDLDEVSPSAGPGSAMTGSRGVDVLSELDLLSAEQQGSGLISGDSANLLGSSVGSGLGSGVGGDLSGIDDALADDDDLIIADDDEDLVINSGGSDISVAGDSGINLMSPSDSGLSLESEPLDLAGSSISALDLGAELSDGSGSGSGSGGSDGSFVDFQADEEFQLSPSGVGLDADIDSGSQVIEVEDSDDAIGEAVEFDDVEAEPLGGDVFGEAEGIDADGGFGDDGEDALAAEDDGEGISLDSGAAVPMSAAAASAYEVPFSILQCVSLMLVLCIMSLGGMLMTDLVRNMWTYNEMSAPVSALTDSLIAWIE